MLYSFYVNKVEYTVYRTLYKKLEGNIVKFYDFKLTPKLSPLFLRI